MSQKLLQFIETEVFTRRIEATGSSDILVAIQQDLLTSLKKWPVVSGTGGARKGRIADKQSGQGKRGGYRYLYFYIERRETIYLLFIYGKTEQYDLTSDQKKVIAKFVKAIEEEK